MTGLAFSADGTRLASAVEEPVLQVDEDGLAQRQPAAPSVLLWNLDLASWNTAACAVAGRNLSRAEWTRYIVWVPETPHTSRDLLILVEQSTEPVAPSDGVRLARRRLGEWS